MNLLENEDLAWERFQQAVTDEDITTCYDMSLKDFEHFAVHDLFKVCLCIFHYFVLYHILLYSFNHFS